MRIHIITTNACAAVCTLVCSMRTHILKPFQILVVQLVLFSPNSHIGCKS